MRCLVGFNMPVGYTGDPRIYRIYFPTGHPGKSHASYESVVSLKCIFPNKKQKHNRLASSSFTFFVETCPTEIR